MNRFCRTVIFTALLLTACGGEKLPSRDEIPVLRERLSKLEHALKTYNRAAVDSLASIRMLDLGQDSDSLMKLVYSPDGSFEFERLGDYEIFYSTKVAVIDCFVMDGNSRSDRPLKLIFERVDNEWLLTEFQSDTPDSL